MPDVDFTIVLPAFLAGLLVLATHIPLGAQVLRRGIVFIASRSPRSRRSA